MLAATAAISVMVRGVIEEADKMSKLSQSLGIPIDELSRLRYAAGLADVDIDTLSKSMIRLAVNMMDSTDNATGPAADAFTRLGISVKDAEGRVKSSTAVLMELATQFKSMPDGVQKTALAVDLFGKAGARMVPLLNAGEDGIRALGEEAERLGIVLDTETGLAAERFNDNLARLKIQGDGVVTQIAVGILPALDRFAAALTITAQNSDGLKSAGRGLGFILNSLIAIVMGLAAALTFAGSNMAAFIRAAVRLPFGGFAQAAVELEHGLSRSRRGAETARDSIVALFAGTSAAAIQAEGVRAAIARSAAQDVIAADRAQAVLDAQQRRADAAAAARAGRSVTAQREVADAVDDTALAHEQAAETLRNDGKQVFEETRTAAERYAAQLIIIGNLLVLKAIDQDQYNRKLLAMQEILAQDPTTQAAAEVAEKARRAARDAVLAELDMASDIQANLEAATYDGIRGGLEAAADGNLGQYLAQRIRSALLDNLAGVFTDLLTGRSGGKKGGAGGIFGAILGGLKLPGFAKGGSIMPGGSGGIDSQIVAFRKSPKERVDITNPGQSFGGTTRVIVTTNDDRFNAYVDNRASPIAAQAGVAAYQGARQAVPSEMFERRRYSRG